MKNTITINCDNAAFGDGNAANEVNRILKAAEEKVETLCFWPEGGILERVLMDVNGNAVGKIKRTGKRSV